MPREDRAESDVQPAVSGDYQWSPEGARLIAAVEAVEEFPFITGLLAFSRACLIFSQSRARQNSTFGMFKNSTLYEWPVTI